MWHGYKAEGPGREGCVRATRVQCELFDRCRLRAASAWKRSLTLVLMNWSRLISASISFAERLSGAAAATGTATLFPSLTTVVQPSCARAQRQPACGGGCEYLTRNGTHEYSRPKGSQPAVADGSALVILRGAGALSESDEDDDEEEELRAAFGFLVGTFGGCGACALLPFEDGWRDDLRLALASSSSFRLRASSVSSSLCGTVRPVAT